MHLVKFYDVRKEIIKYVFEETIIFDKLQINLNREKIKDSQRNNKSKGNPLITSRTDIIVNKNKENKHFKSFKKEAITYKNPKILDLKNFNSINLNKKGLIKKVCYGEQINISRLNNQTPIMTCNEPQNSTLNNSNLETTVNKASQNNSNSGKQITTPNLLNQIFFHNNKSDIIFKQKNESTKSLKANIILKNSSRNMQNIIDNKCVGTLDNSKKSRNNYFHKDNDYFITVNNNFKYKTINSDLKITRQNTPLLDNEIFKPESRLKEAKHKKNTNSCLQIEIQTSLNEKGIHDINKNFKSIQNLKRSIKSNNTQLKCLDARPKGINKKNTNPIMSFCQELLLKNEAQIFSLFNNSNYSKKLRISNNNQYSLRKQTKK